MKFSIQAGELARLLGAVKGSLPGSTTIPILRCVHLEVAAGQISARTSNCEMETIARGSADISEDGSRAVPCAMLLDIVRKLPKSATVELALAGERLNVTSAQSKYKLGTLAAEDFPVMERRGGVTFDMPAATLKQMLEATRHSVCTQAARYYLAGVYLHLLENPARIAAAATDAHVLTKFEAPAPEGSVGMPAVIIPTATVNLLVSVLAGIDGNVTLSIGASRFEMKHATGELVSKLIDGEFPDYNRVIPLKNGAAMTVRSELMADAADRAGSVLASSQDESDSVGIARGDAGITIAAGGMRGHSEEGVEHVDAAVHSDFAEFGVSRKLLSQTLRLFSDSEVDIQTADPTSALLITAVDKPDLIAVVMPMRR